MLPLFTLPPSMILHEKLFIPHSLQIPLDTIGCKFLYGGLTGGGINVFIYLFKYLFMCIVFSLVCISMYYYFVCISYVYWVNSKNHEWPFFKTILVQLRYLYAIRFVSMFIEVYYIQYTCIVYTFYCKCLLYTVQ